MKTLAIDFGDRRVGLASSDPEGRLAVPGRVLERVSDAAVIAEIVAGVIEGQFERVVLGLPRRLDGTDSEATRRVRSFGRKLEHRMREAKIEARLILRDEALTSVEAERIAAEGDRAPIDAVAAQILLQEVLDDDARSALADPADVATQ